MSSTPQEMKTELYLYYRLKPFVPRAIQLWLRRRIIHKRLQSNRHRWPILDKAARHPQQWTGWPDEKKFALVLTHDVEHEVGLSRCRELALLEKTLGFCSSFNFVPKRYDVPGQLLTWLKESGFEIGVHGLIHDGRLYESEKTFLDRAKEINHYLDQWGSVGFRSPAMHRNLAWIGDLDIEYDLSSFDTDPFEPQSVGVETIFPFLVERRNGGEAYVEMPYTVPQDHTLFVIMQEQTIDIWKRKIDWVAQHGGMILVNVHPDYLSFDGKQGRETYPADLYREFLTYIEAEYSGQYWNALPRNVAEYFRAGVTAAPGHRFSKNMSEKLPANPSANLSEGAPRSRQVLPREPLSNEATLPT